jgi:signal transduction histidine kinase
LGKLVAGIAHELNTPLGNGVMAVSTLSDRLGQFEREASSGLRKSALAAYLEDSRSGLDIALRNLRRAAGLIGDFKQLAVDRTSDQRREFFLDEVVRENLLALHPVLKRMPFRRVTDIPEGIRMDGFPGLLGQSFEFGEQRRGPRFRRQDSGTVTVRARRDGDRMRLEWRTTASHTRTEPQHIFEPFFTTRRGSGGSGLGLNLAHNAATTVPRRHPRLRVGGGEGPASYWTCRSRRRKGRPLNIDEGSPRG